MLINSLCYLIYQQAFGIFDILGYSFSILQGTVDSLIYGTLIYALNK